MINKLNLGVEDSVLVASTGLYDYRVDAHNYERVSNIARKCVTSGVFGSILRPFRVSRLESLVTESDSSALYGLEETLAGEGFEIHFSEHFRGSELAQQILNTISESGE